MLRVWIGRLAIIPLLVYALGTPLELYIHRAIFLVADEWLPFEIVGLSACIILVIQSTINMGTREPLSIEDYDRNPQRDVAGLFHKGSTEEREPEAQ